MTETVTVTPGRLGAVILAALLVGAGSGAAASLALTPPSAPVTGSPSGGTANGSIAAFESAADFRAYLRAGQNRNGGRLRGATGRTSVEMAEPVARADRSGGTPRQATTIGDDGPGLDRRVSGTNVQVAGIDEPDRLKTTADTFYYATRAAVRQYGVEEPRSRTVGVDDRDRTGGRIHLLDATDPAAPALASRIYATGRLLLAGDTLVVLSHDAVLGYDVSSRAAPERRWSQDLSGNLAAARLFDGHLYLVTEQRVDGDSPCPVRPMPEVDVPCTSIHHPVGPVPVDTTYTVTVLNPDDGTVDDTAGFVGAAGSSVVSVSNESVYVTYPEPVDRTAMLFEFFLTEQADRLDQDTLARIRQVRQYDLSPRASRYELKAAVNSWLAGLDDDERAAAQEAIRSDLRTWAAENKRAFQRTGIAEFRIHGSATSSPSVAPGATGTVPGRPLDQFALDEHDGHLRVATTVDGVYGTDSANDVYVLDSSLDVMGAVRDMGLTERIYSVRFHGDEAYVVTFRRIDPFHVLDLSDPSEPTLAGELKLPGFSTYLHSLDQDRVLGIGEEDGRVKVVVFDVADPSNPTIDDSRILDARWSAVANSHHAFLLDPRHQVFFLPAGSEGHVFSYEAGLDRVTTVSVDGSARRAAYVGNYLYVFGDRSLTVVDETTWEPVHQLSLS